MEKIHNKIMDIDCLTFRSPSGVRVFMVPMEKYSSAAAYYSVRFGSRDNCFSVNGGEFAKIPDGTAHYLEHKLFESEEKDAFALFAETGGSANAGTSFDYTQYYFTCGENFRENLDILLGFVQEPYFTPENVEKERGIITQEITMYRDNPSWRVFGNLLAGIYKKNPVRLDIAGTAESIAKINENTLYDCYNAFYNPANSFLCVAGNFEPNDVYELCCEKLKDRDILNVATAPFDEPKGVLTHRMEDHMLVAKPIFEIGFKMPENPLKTQAESYVIYNILMDIMFGVTSEFFSSNREKGLINGGFSASVFNGRGFFVPIARGESSDPDTVLEEMQEHIRRFKKEPPSKEDFKRIKLSLYGDMVRDYSSADSVASILTDAALDGEPPFSVIESAAAADYDTLIKALDMLDEENVCVSVIKEK